MYEVPYEDYQTYVNKFIVDMIFYVLINIMLMNVVFGIIVDGFADLRETGKAKGKYFFIFPPVIFFRIRPRE